MSAISGDPLQQLPGNVLGLDVGNRRLGVAVLATDGAHIHPLDIVERGRGKDDWALLQCLVRKYRTEGFIVGMPLLPSGDEGDQSKAVRGYVNALRERYPGIWIALVDERHTSSDAALELQGVGLSAKAQRGRLDALAAANILRAYLELGALEIVP